MKYINIDHQGKVNNNEPIFDGGTQLVDTICISYQKLVDTFGEPNSDDDGFKVDVVWQIFTPSGVATIYNWKDGKNYLGQEGLEVEEITEWHIGAHWPKPASWVKEALGLPENAHGFWPYSRRGEIKGSEAQSSRSERS